MHFPPHITTVPEELDRLLEQWPENPGRTPEEATRWNGNKLPHVILGTDHHNCLVLERDGLPVCAVLKNTVAHWFENDAQTFIHLQDAVRVGLFFHQDDHGILALALKVLWEKYVFDCKQHDVTLRRFLKDAGRLEPLSVGFNPDTDKLFQLFDGHDLLTAEDGYDARSFDTLVQEMLLGGMHLVGLDSPELESFIQQGRQRQRMLREGTPAQQESHWISRCALFEKHRELEDLHFTAENRRLENENVHLRYLAAVGEELTELQRQEGRLELARVRLTIKEELEEITHEELEEEVARRREELARELESLRLEVNSSAAMVVLGQEGGVPVSPEEREEYERAVKKVIHKICWLTHEDRLSNNEAFEKLTERQQAFLSRTLQKMNRINDLEKGRPQNNIGHKMRDLAVLNHILEQVELTLQNAGIDIDVELKIQGDTLPLQLEWMERELARLTRFCERVRAELKCLLEDPEVGQKQRVLADAGKVEILKREMKTSAERISREADDLERALGELFGTGS